VLVCCVAVRVDAAWFERCSSARGKEGAIQRCLLCAKVTQRGVSNLTLLAVCVPRMMTIVCCPFLSPRDFAGRTFVGGSVALLLGSFSLLPFLDERSLNSVQKEV